MPALRLHGGLPAAERARVRAAITPQSPGPLVVLAIDKIAGEGRRSPRLRRRWRADARAHAPQAPPSAGEERLRAGKHAAASTAWARATGIDVTPRGKLNTEVRAAYEMAYSTLVEGG